MKLIIFSLLLASTLCHLQRPVPRLGNFKGFIRQPMLHLEVETSCNNVDIPEHDGVTLSGYLNVGIENSNSALGFTFYGRKNTARSELKNYPTIFWLNGGPGCSSQFGNFFEIGPLSVSEPTKGEFSFKENKGSWASLYNLVFVDQPIGTGISYAESEEEIPKSQTEIAKHFFHALTELYNSPNGCFNQIGLNGKDTPIFFYGESYAGKYIPSITREIIKNGNPFNLKGIGLGDAFTSPFHTLKAISDFSYEKNFIDSGKYEFLQGKSRDAQKLIEESRFTEAQNILQQIIEGSNPKGVDIYNINRFEEPSTQPMNNLFNSKFGQELFHTQLNKDYETCELMVYDALSEDFIQSGSIADVQYLLEAGVSVNVFNGDLDLIVPHINPMMWIKSMTEWNDLQNFSQVEPRILEENGKAYASIQEYGGLRLMIIFDSGHMVPQDQPQTAYKMIQSAVNSALNRTAKPIEQVVSFA